MRMLILRVLQSIGFSVRGAQDGGEPGGLEDHEVGHLQGAGGRSGGGGHRLEPAAAEVPALWRVGVPAGSAGNAGTHLIRTGLCNRR